MKVTVTPLGIFKAVIELEISVGFKIKVPPDATPLETVRLPPKAPICWLAAMAATLDGLFKSRFAKGRGNAIPMKCELRKLTVGPPDDRVMKALLNKLTVEPLRLTAPLFDIDT